MNRDTIIGGSIAKAARRLSRISLPIGGALLAALALPAGALHAQSVKPQDIAAPVPPLVQSPGETANSQSDITNSSRNGLLSLAPLVDTVTPAVVNIAVKSKGKADPSEMLRNRALRHFFGLPDNGLREDRIAVGSGVIVDAGRGYIVTNAHVVDDATDITVTLRDQREFSAKVIGKDPPTDIAVVQIDANTLAALPIGDSNTMRVGDYVLAVGNPFGLGQTVTSGIVSALGRSGLDIEGYEDFIQTDAPINPGNSGGALVNLKGELIGINTAIVGPTGGNVGVGFAVPTSMAQVVMDELIKSGKVSRGMLGVAVQSLTPDLANKLGVSQSQGALIAQVQEGSAAEAAGLKTADVVVAVNGAPVRSADSLRARIGLIAVGDTVDLTILRDGQKENVKATISKATPAELQPAAPRIEQAHFRLMPLLIGLLAMLFAYRVVRYTFRRTSKAGLRGSSLELLGQRYARGEIGRDEYLQKKHDLQG